MFSIKPLALALSLFALPIYADDYESPPLKFVYEQYDDAVIQHFQREGHDWVSTRIFFCRKGRVIAERYYDPSSFRITLKPDNKINIEFEDYSTYQRSIDVDFLSEGPGVYEDDVNNFWWAANRNMRDLATE